MRRHKVKKSSFETEINLGIWTALVYYSGDPHQPMVESVLIGNGNDEFDIVGYLDSDVLDDLARQAANHEVDKYEMQKEEYQFKQWKESD